MTLEVLLGRMKAELGLKLPGPASQLNPALPQVLVDFYTVADGLRLPFLEIVPASEASPFQVSQTEPRTWIQFGSDGYFTWYLCALSSDATTPIAAWDHESGTPIEPTYASVPALLESEYERILSDDGWRADVVVDAMPADVSIAKIVALVKSDVGGSSADLLSSLRKPKFEITDLRVSTATKLCQFVNGSSGTARLTKVEPRDSG